MRSLSFPGSAITPAKVGKPGPAYDYYRDDAALLRKLADERDSAGLRPFTETELSCFLRTLESRFTYHCPECDAETGWAQWSLDRKMALKLLYLPRSERAYLPDGRPVIGICPECQPDWSPEPIDKQSVQSDTQIEV